MDDSTSSGRHRGRAAGSGIDAFVIVRGLHGLRQVLARTATGVEPSSGQQPAPRVAIEAVPLALRVRPEGTAHVGSLLPFEAEPVQVFQHGLAEMRLRAVGIKILVAQDQSALGCDARAVVRSRRCARGPGAGTRWERAPAGRDKCFCQESSRNKTQNRSGMLEKAIRVGAAAPANSMLAKHSVLVPYL